MSWPIVAGFTVFDNCGCKIEANPGKWLLVVGLMIFEPGE